MSFIGAAARACAQSAAQPAAGRSQPASSVGHSSLTRSPFQPGRSAQSAATQRDWARSSTSSGTATAAGGTTAAAVAALPVAAAAGCSGASISGGGVPAQPASRPRIAAASAGA